MTNPTGQAAVDPNISTYVDNNPDNNPPGQIDNPGNGNADGNGNGNNGNGNGGNGNNPSPSPSSSPTPMPSETPEFSTGGYTEAGNFKVDRDTFNEWQAIGVAVKGNTIYVAAADNKGLLGTGLTKKGTVLQMDATSGQSWKDLAKGFLGLTHPIDETVKGLAVDKGNNLFAVDNTQLYSLLSPKYSAKKAKIGSGAIDIASEGSYLFVATSGELKKYSADLTGGSAVGSNLNFTGGICGDGKGNIYGVCGTVIKKIELNGNSTDVVTNIDYSAIDVAVDNAGNIFVLSEDGVLKYTNGQLVAIFGEGSVTYGASIAVDDSNNVYVADTGTSYKDSKIVKYSTSGLSTQALNFISTMNDPDANLE